MASPSTTTVTRTLRLKVKPEAYAWLNHAAFEVNQVWNWCNETSFRAIRRFSGPGEWLSKIDLCNLSAGATEYFEHIGADTIQRICYEYTTRRRQFKKVKLRWRASGGARRALGWVPLKPTSIQRTKLGVRFCGKHFRIFERNLLDGVKWRSGCFAQDAVGDWWLCLPVEHAIQEAPAANLEVGIDLGLKVTAVTSDADRLEALHAYRSREHKIAQLQRLGHKRQAKREHRRAVRCRRDAIHKFSRSIVDRYQNIFIGNVSSLKLAKTRMAKSVLDAGWGLLKMQLQYKGEHAGRNVEVVDERYTSCTCASCGARSGPTGLSALHVRQWVCSACGDTHDRDVNAARNILAAGRCARPSDGAGRGPAVSGNESSSAVRASSELQKPRKTRISALPEAA